MPLKAFKSNVIETLQNKRPLLLKYILYSREKSTEVISSSWIFGNSRYFRHKLPGGNNRGENPSSSKRGSQECWLALLSRFGEFYISRFTAGRLYIFYDLCVYKPLSRVVCFQATLLFLFSIYKSVSWYWSLKQAYCVNPGWYVSK